ncbi:uncharacterized protein LOC136068148 [Quercus suber]|uniref:uncharacterized protein LOC136068148 n=1 Tax=Quercus suber TaxID=58331 RepID=UPI0032DE38F7
MDRSQSLNVPPFFMARPEAAKSTWDKATLAAANANSKALNAIFCGVSPEEFHRISHITVTKKAWEILKTTYEGTKKVKDTKLQMLTTRFEELKMSEDESFDSFYSKLNKVVVSKFNLGEKTKDSKVVRKILQSLPESFRAKVMAIEESKDLDDIKVQELRKSKSLALKTIDERVASHDPLEEDAVDKDVAYIVKNFRRFFKLKNGGKFGDKGKFQSFEKEKKEFRRKDDKDFQSSQGITCFECNGHGHFKKECPNYLKSKGKFYATTLSDSDSSNSDSEESYDGEGNYFAFMTIAHVESSDDLGSLVKELGEHFDLESIGVVEESEAEEDEDTSGLQENYVLLLEKSSEYANVAKAAVKKMKRAEEDYKSLLVRYKEAKCEIEALNGELSEAYTKVRFLEQEVVQAHAKIDRVSSKKLEDVISSQKHASNKSGLGYTGRSSSSANVTKEVKFVKAKKTAVDKSSAEKVKAEKKKNMTDQRVFNKSRNQSEAKFGARGRSLPRSQQGPRTNNLCHYC